MTAPGPDNQRQMVANSDRNMMRRYRMFGLTLFVTVLAIAVFGYWLLNRETEILRLSVGAGPYGSDSFELMQEVAEVVSRHSETLELSVLPSKDSSQNISLLNQGDIDLATIRSDTPVVSDVRLIANLFQDYFQIIALANRPIFQVNDLVGKAVAIPGFGTDEFRSFWIVGDHCDLPIAGVRWRAMNFETAKAQLLDEKIDALFTVRSLRDGPLLNLFADAELKNLALRYVEIDQAEAIAIKRPFLEIGTVPKGAFLGKQPTPARDATTATVDRVLVARESSDPAAIRELTRILFEHRLDLTIRFALASAIRKPNEGTGLGIPLHEGAEQYFTRDEPSFIQENAEPLALLVTLTAMLGSGLFALRSRLSSGQKDRMDSYNYEVLAIAERAKDCKSRSEIRELKQELFTLLEEAVRALDRDAVTDAGFQSFSLLWESVREMVSDRMDDIKD